MHFSGPFTASIFSSLLLISLPFTSAIPLEQNPHRSVSTPLGNTVQLGYASYESRTNGLGVNEFLGMRFAAPPLGDLRFRAPQDPLNETAVIKADQHGPICLSVTQPFVPANPSSEDCLFVDVYTPASASAESRLPVVLWIQGGADTTNFDANFNGSSLIKASDDNMIVVTFNYRVGIYGFLASEDIRNDGDLNVGMLDQRKAMEWTKKHIAAFGGDPNHIVLMGTSSGGGSVVYQLAAYDGDTSDLFVGAIASSSYFTHVLPVPQLEFQYQQLLNATGCAGVACLRALPGAQLQAANVARPYAGSNSTALFPYAPCIDGEFFTDHPVSLFKQAKFTAVPLIIGNTVDEGTIFQLEANTSAQVSSDLKTQYPELTAKDLKKINKLYPFDAAAQNPNHTPFYASASAAYGEGIMTSPSMDIARTIVSQAAAAPAPNATVWDYRYDVRDPANIALGLGVPHTFEIDAVWGPGFAVNPAGSNSYTGVNAPIVPVVQAYWQSFIRTLDPNTYRAPGSPEWCRFADNQWLHIQTNATRMETQPHAEARRFEFWTGISASLYQ